LGLRERVASNAAEKKDWIKHGDKLKKRRIK
jgi:hypothetical protein